MRTTALMVVSDTPRKDITYTYDEVGQRVMKAIAGGLTTYYAHDAFGPMAAEYTSGGAAAAPCSTCYLSWDHLG